MRRNALPLAVLLAAGLAAASCEDATEGQEIFTTTLSGANEVPARNTGANGFSQIIIDGDRVHYAVEIDDISNVFAAHIHTGATGVNGPVRVTFFSNSASPLSVTEKTILNEGTFTASDVSGISFADLLAAIRAGTAYVNVHTTQFPGGEIRGQLQRAN
ncbi:MAG TPA: CHRD domain-containing protein [Vicinamibacteria bacterium]|nr:CHRD domain-containing protein [Vicinamibacteria bacterium]